MLPPSIPWYSLVQVYITKVLRCDCHWSTSGEATVATVKVISVHAFICDSMQSGWLYSASQLGNQTTRTRTWYPTQSHYPYIEPTTPCPILVPGKEVTSINFKVIHLTHQGFDPARFSFADFPKGETHALLIRPSSLVIQRCILQSVTIVIKINNCPCSHNNLYITHTARL